MPKLKKKRPERDPKITHREFLMPMNTLNHVSVWFNNLKSIQSRMKELTHLTKYNLKEFSKQKLKELLTKNDMKENLAQYCQMQKIGLVPSAAYKDMDKTFLWFLDRISYSSEASLLILFYSVAVRFNPDLLNISAFQFKDKTIDEAFGDEALDNNEAKQALDQLLEECVPGVFYPPAGGPLTTPTLTVQDAIAEILL